METLTNPNRFLSTIRQHLVTAPATATQPATRTKEITLFDLDVDQDFSPLDAAIEAALPAGCKSAEFVDDNRKRGYRALEYNVTIRTGYSHDEDGWAPKYETFPVSIAVRDGMSLYSMVFLLLGEINHLLAA